MSLSVELVEALKRSLRAQDMGYRELAARLGLSEAAVKRMFSLRAMNLQRLEEICDVLDLGLAELTAEASRERKLTQLSEAQEAALVKQPQLLLGLFLVLNRWSQADVLAHFNFDAVAWTRILVALDRLEVITLEPGNRARLRTSRNFRWRRDGPMERHFRANLLNDYFSDAFDGEQDALYLLTGSLSVEGVVQMRERLRELAREFDALLARDATLPVSQRQGVGLVLAQKPWILQAFHHLRRPHGESSA